MKYFDKKAFFAILAVAVLASVGFVGSKSSKAQTVEGYLIEGERFDNINIGRSTSEDVEANYGRDYKLVNHRNYSFEMIYKNLGLSFYYCHDDPNKEIFVVGIESPARVTTSKGIILGESNFADVLRLYDSRETVFSDADYEGILFYSFEDKESKDQPDSRTQPQVTTTSETEETTDQRTDLSKVVLDGEEVLDTNDEKLNDGEIKTEENAEFDEFKSKIVKRIELIENGGLRQCDDKSPKK